MKATKKKKRAAVKMRPPKAAVRYDDALPIFTGIVLAHVGKKGLAHNCFLRDADGNLTYIIREKLIGETRGKLSVAAKKSVGRYVTDNPVATPEELFDDQLKDETRDTLEYVTGKKFEVFVRLVERRIVGQDWVRGIWPPIDGVPPVVVFASHKGGVGRSTALLVSAVEFARRGYSILAIDADLEAPGLGEMFIPESRSPQFGALDYFVENGRGTVNAKFLTQMQSISTLTRGKGKISVVPAVGMRCREFPQNVIGKISRAYLEDMPIDGSRSKTLLEQMRDMVRDLSAIRKYDAIFVDARAGLNETTAATVQGLGADVLFFGVDTPQTWDGYRYFLAHLARFKPEDRDDDWRFRLKMVHAKALNDPKALAHFRDNSFELFAEHLYDEINESEEAGGGSFGFDVDDPTAPHFAWPIMMDPKFYEFDPVAHPEQILPDDYQTSFGEFVSNLADRLGLK
jgi:CO dehydrogenase nickel-insertion accessory protein CooC1